jgi:hypothetical protein
MKKITKEMMDRLKLYSKYLSVLSVTAVRNGEKREQGSARTLNYLNACIQACSQKARTPQSSIGGIVRRTPVSWRWQSPAGWDADMESRTLDAKMRSPS